MSADSMMYADTSLPSLKRMNRLFPQRLPDCVCKCVQYNIRNEIRCTIPIMTVVSHLYSPYCTSFDVLDSIFFFF